jgi:hypothetical protein
MTDNPFIKKALAETKRRQRNQMAIHVSELSALLKRCEADTAIHKRVSDRLAQAKEDAKHYA